MSPEKENQATEDEPSHLEQRVMECAKALNEGKDVEGMLLEMLETAGAQALADPSPDLIWKLIADECETMGNWAAAEDARKKSLELAKEHPNPAFALRPHLDLASLYEILGRRAEAIPHVEAALELARQSGIESLLLMALEAKYSPELGKPDLDRIREEAGKGFDALPMDRIYRLTNARFLLLQARCAAEIGKYESAEQHLAGARELVNESNQSDFMTGYQFYHSRVAAVVAKIHAGRGEIEKAISVFSETIERERTINSQPHVQGIRTRYRLARALQAFGNYLEAGGRTTETTQARAEAKEILTELKLPVGEG